MTVTCLFVNGEYPYTTEYVWRLYDMVNRWIDRPFTFVVLTDQPDHVDFQEFITVPVQKLPDCFAYWTKLELFNPVREWQGRVLYLDLDVLIVAPLAPIIDFPDAFALSADPYVPGMRTKDAYGRQIVRKFNSSVMVWNGGAQTDMFNAWTPDVARRLSGDQDWLGERAMASGMPRAWCPRLSEVVRPPIDPEAKIILTKFPKNHIAVKESPWIAEYWGAAREVVA